MGVMLLCVVLAGLAGIGCGSPARAPVAALRMVGPPPGFRASDECPGVTSGSFTVSRLACYGRSTPVVGLNGPQAAALGRRFGLSIGAAPARRIGCETETPPLSTERTCSWSQRVGGSWLFVTVMSNSRAGDWDIPVGTWLMLFTFGGRQRPASVVLRQAVGRIVRSGGSSDGTW
jgi:hypothetical protein